MIIKSYFRYSVKFLIAFALVFSTALLEKSYAQISADKASYRTLTEYTSTINDSIFVFCDNIGTGVGELRADSPDGTSGWTFNWAKWEVGTNDFTLPLITESNQGFSILSNLTDGRYQVVISKSGETDVTDVAWILNNTNTSGLSFKQVDCIGVHFTADFLPKNLQYENVDNLPNKKNVISDLNDLKIKFSLLRGSQEILTATEDLQSLPFNNINKNFIDQEAFEGEETYELVVTDQYGCEFTSNAIASNTYVVKADFSVDPEKGEAPLDVTITNSSVNGTDYEWYFYQDYKRIEEGAVSVQDSLIENEILLADDKDPFDFTYQHPGDYFVKLIVKSDKGPDVCTDEMILKTPIEVDTSLVQVANYFIPSRHGKWIVKSQSLKSFKGIIFNRWGRVLYEWRNPEDSWDGKVNGKMATPGTYFYVITAVGREEETKKYTKKGSFMLIRK
ncbi:MAG: gliding motility-associated C-terminal domain-containing protein [Marinifilum sp.]|jgi:gliding motility-associated-like protein|nr:gliding motility-associated C-terminal domain-containing protein [Marinifilum sp.]